MTELRIWPRHLYSVPYLGRVGYCAAGARQWWAEHGLDWADFVAHGIPAETLHALRDPLADAVIQHAMEVERG